jgi:hypothetical protein
MSAPRANCRAIEVAGCCPEQTRRAYSKTETQICSIHQSPRGVDRVNRISHAKQVFPGRKEDNVRQSSLEAHVASVTGPMHAGSDWPGKLRQALSVCAALEDRSVSILDVADPSQPAVLETTFWPEGAPVHFSRRLCCCRGSVQQPRSASDGGACCAASVAS